RGIDFLGLRCLPLPTPLAMLLKGGQCLWHLTIALPGFKIPLRQFRLRIGQIPFGVRPGITNIVDTVFLAEGGQPLGEGFPDGPAVAFAEMVVPGPVLSHGEAVAIDLPERRKTMDV